MKEHDLKRELRAIRDLVWSQARKDREAIEALTTRVDALEAATFCCLNRTCNLPCGCA